MFSELHTHTHNLAAIIPALIALGSFLTAGAAAGGLAAFIGAQFVLSVAYTAYSTISAYKQGQKAKEAAKRAELESRERNARKNFRASVMPKRTIYGRDRLGGGYLFADNPNSSDAVLVISLADHEIEAVEEVRMMDEKLDFNPITGEVSGKYKNRLWVWVYLGKPGQNLSGRLKSLGCSTVGQNDKFEGTACLVVRTRDLLVAFPDIDVHFNALIKGRNDIFDPRTGETGWTDNAALCAANYTQKFMGFDSARISQDALKASADVCDEQVQKKDGTTEKRYTINGVITSEQEHRATLPDLAMAMAGNIAFVGGSWIFHAGRHVEPAAHFTADDILADFEYRYKGSAKDVPNVGKGTFKSPLHNWQSVGIPEYIDADKLAAAGGERREIDISLPFTNSPTMAQRILKIVTKRSQMEEGASLVLKPSALIVSTLDTATFDIPRHGIEGKAFEIHDFTTRYSVENGGTRFDCQVVITEYDPAIYAYDPQTEEKEIPAASVSIGNNAGTVPTEIEIVDIGSSFDINWKNPTSAGKTITQTEIKYTLQDIFSGTTTTTIYATGAAETITITPPAGYTYRTLEMRTHWDDDSKSVWVSP